MPCAAGLIMGPYALNGLTDISKVVAEYPHLSFLLPECIGVWLAFPGQIHSVPCNRFRVLLDLDALPSHCWPANESAKQLELCNARQGMHVIHTAHEQWVDRCH